MYLPVEPLCSIQFSYTPPHLEFPGCANNRLQDVYQEYTFIKSTKKKTVFKSI